MLGQRSTVLSSISQWPGGSCQSFQGKLFCGWYPSFKTNRLFWGLTPRDMEERLQSLLCQSVALQAIEHSRTFHLHWEVQNCRTKCLLQSKQRKSSMVLINLACLSFLLWYRTTPSFRLHLNWSNLPHTYTITTVNTVVRHLMTLPTWG